MTFTSKFTPDNRMLFCHAVIPWRGFYSNSNSTIASHGEESPIKWKITLNGLNDWSELIGKAKTLCIEPVDKAVNTIFKYKLSISVNSSKIYGVCVYNGDTFNCGLPNGVATPIEINIVYPYEAIIFCKCSVEKLVAPLQLSIKSNVPLTKPRSREEFFDVQFMVENKPIVAHKIILADRSEVFRKMFIWNVDDSKNNEPIPIIDVSYDAFNQFIDTIYYGTTPTDPKICLEIVSLAEKYDIQDVKITAETPVIESISIDNAISIMVFSHQFNADRIKKAALKFCAKSHIHEMNDCKELAKFPELMIEVFKEMSLLKK